MKFISALALLACASSAAAHFTLDYPTSRGFDEDIESDNFCGGFHNVSLPRQAWYYKNGPIEIDSHHDSATVNIYISYSPPTSAQSFLAAAPMRHDIAITGQGEFCFHANASASTEQGVNVAEGTNATIMVEYINNVHGHLYQCTDVTFTNDATVGSNITCTDQLTAENTNGTSTSSASGSAASASSTGTSTSKENSATALAGLPMSSLLLASALLAGALTLA